MISSLSFTNLLNLFIIVLIIGIISTVVWLAVVPFFSRIVTSVHYTRISLMVFLMCLVLNVFLNLNSTVIELYHSLFMYSSFSVCIDSLLFVVAALVLVCFSPADRQARTNGHSPNEAAAIQIKPEYSLILMFSILGASIMISSNDIISIYVALELQSFGLYLLACLRTDQAGSTHASLKYFLLGAISSAFILLGISMIYQEVGSTGFQNISSFLQCTVDLESTLIEQDPLNSLIGGQRIMALGLLSMLCGFMFKISAAPFHSWFSDVIQGVPTYTSMVIMNLPKISIFTFLFNLFLVCGTVSTTGLSLAVSWETFIVITTLFSLMLGTVAGLMQTKLKRLLAFSTISHVGFILIGLTSGSEASLNAIVFYLIQYTLTVVLTFLALLAYESSYINHPRNYSTSSSQGLLQVDYIVDLQGTGQYYKLLTFTFVLCLFSIAGIPPLTGFYAKLEVLNSSVLQNISIVFLTAIVCSVISAAYYLKVIKVLIFDSHSTSTITPNANAVSSSHNSSQGLELHEVLVSPLHGYMMAVLTAFICLFILDPQLILNCTELVALSLYLL